MSRRLRTIRNIGIGLAAFLLVLAVVAVITVQTNWFRDYVKRKIITATEQGTGGRAGMGSFAFDWTHLRAVVTDFVIHGTEPAGSKPWVRVGRIQVDLRLFGGRGHLVDLSYLGIDRPDVAITVAADGSTNIPTPKQTSSSNSTPLETVVDLAVGHFELSNGLLEFNSQQQALDLRAENLRAQLWYSLLKQGYQGQVSLEPLYVVSGRNTPVRFALTLPVSLGRDRIDLRGARISTAASQILIDASLVDLRHPKTWAHASGHVALADVKNCSNLPFTPEASGPLSVVDLDADANVADNAIQVTKLRLVLGHSSVEASGKLKDAAANGSLEFQARLAAGELGRLLKVTARPDGTVVLAGTAKLDASNNYQVSGNVQAKDVSFQAGDSRIANVSLSSGVRLDPHRLDLTGARLTAWGGELTANGTLADFARFKLSGDLRHLDLRSAAAAMGEKNFAYAGVASGPISAEGDLNRPGAQSISGHARISIAPGRQGVPMSGRLNAEYSGATNDVSVSDSYIALPHSRLTLAGSLHNRLNVALTTHDLSDLLAVLPPANRPAVSLDAGGQATMTGTVTGSLAAPRITAHLAANRISAEGRHFDAVALDAAASSGGAAISNGNLTRGVMQTQFAASVGLRNWKAGPDAPLSGSASVRNGDLADMLALAGSPSAGYSGALSASVNVSGTVGNPAGAANVSVSNGAIDGEPFDSIQTQVTMADQLITIPAFTAAAGPARINLTAEFQHPRDSLANGRLHARLQTNQVDLAQFRTVQKELPGSSGQIQVQAEISGNLSQARSGVVEQPTFLATAVSADASARNINYQGESYGDFQATARTHQQSVQYEVTSDFAGSKINLNGSTELARDYPTKLDGTISNLAVERVLTLAKRTDIPAKGNLSITLHLTGTTQKPEGNASLDLANAVLYNEPIDHVRADIGYMANSIDVSKFDAVSGQSHISLTAKYDHPAGDLQQGDLQFQVKSSRVDLARIRNVQTARPGLGGTLQISATGAAAIRQTGTRVLFRSLDANVAANGITAQGKKFGDLTLAATTSGGALNFTLDSNLAEASLHGQGTAGLNGDYPLKADVTFNNVAWSRVSALLRPAGEAPSFDAVMDGEATVNGPAAKAEELNGSLKVTRLNLTANAQPGNGRHPLVIQNQGPIAVTLTNGTARIDSLHLTGAETDLQAQGTASMHDGSLNVTVNANANLAVAKQLNRDVVSSGAIVLAATVRGNMSKPLINGKLELNDASFNYTEFPNGISHAKGVLQFNGDSASLKNLTAESGGGKITLTGFVAYRDEVRFGLHASAANVRVRPQEGLSAVFDAKLSVAGTSQASEVNGLITVDRITYAPQSDLGSLLSRASPPVDTSSSPSPLLDNMKLDVQVRSATSLAVRASMVQSLQADADLHIRGTASQPGLLGRISIREGQLVFFNSTYTVNAGTISFFNPTRIAPVLDLSLNTQAKGVNVVLKVSGPIDDMKLNYTSDPPLQFEEIVQLLAAGKTPTSDPTILANQPPDPPQTFTQMGESAVVSKAVADPVANQLQRVFGVSQLSVDPVFTSGSDLPQARLTLQQRISSNMTFTYVTALNAPNTQIIRAEWALSPQWAALAMRDENGIVSVRLTYKRQFR